MENNVAVVTGGSRGIGKAIVQYLFSRNFHVYFTFRSSEEEAFYFKSELNKTSSWERHATALRVDQSNRAEVTNFAQHVLSKEGHVDVLVNNAAITRDKLLAVMSDDDWDNVIDTNITGMAYLTRPIVKAMMKRKSGRIINITSVSGLIGIEGQTNYCATKAAIIGFTRALSKETATRDIPVNAVAPGFIETGMTSHIPPAAVLDVPMKKMGTVHDVANLVAYLATEAPTYITGQTIAIDGGLST